MHNFFKKIFPTLCLISILISVWEFITRLGIIPKFMLPSPFEVFCAFFVNFPILIKHSLVTLCETACGLIISLVLALFVAVFMDKHPFFKRAVYPVLIITQTVPTIVVAPIIVLLFGYGVLPKIVLVSLCCFFPLTVSLFEGFTNIDEEYFNIFRSMKATYFQMLFHLKIPFAMPYFFSGLKVALTYAFISAVTAEWLGGSFGLGVYMTRVKSAYAFDKLFAAVIFISLTSFFFVNIISCIQDKILKCLHIDFQNKRG